MNIFEAKHILRTVGFNLTKNLNEEINGLDNIKYIDPEENLNTDMEDVLGPEAYEDEPSIEDEPTDSDQFMAIEDALSDCGCDANQIAEIMTNCADTINEYLLDGMSPEEIAEKLAVDGCPECDACEEEAAIEEAKKIITKNGYKFIKESKKYAGKHPIFSGKEFQEYLLKECGTSCDNNACSTN